MLVILGLFWLIAVFVPDAGRGAARVGLFVLLVTWLLFRANRFRKTTFVCCEPEPEGGFLCEHLLGDGSVHVLRSDSDLAQSAGFFSLRLPMYGEGRPAASTGLGGRQELADMMRQRRVSFVFRPQVQQHSDGSWIARYPRADWSVTAGSPTAAVHRLREAERDRMGDSRNGQWQAEAARDHLQHPRTPGVYQLGADMSARITDSRTPEAALDEIIAELDGRGGRSDY